MQDHLCGFWKLRYHGVGRTLFMYVQHSVRPTPCSHCINSSNNLSSLIEELDINLGWSIEYTAYETKW